MNTSIQKTFVVVVSVIVVLFLLFDGGGMSATTAAGDAAVTSVLSEHSWVWVVPTLMIFGLGFLLAWVVLGKEDTSPKERHAPDEITEGRIPMNACYWERLEDRRHGQQ